MKNIFIKSHWIIILTAILIISGTVSAQSKVGTTIGQFLKIGPSSRASALGGAAASLSGEPSLSFYNSASLGHLDAVSLQFTHNQWLADIKYNYAIFALPLFNIGNLSLQFISLDSDEMDVRTVENPDGTGERFKVNNVALGLGYSLMLTDRVSVGVQVNYIQESIWHSSFSTFSLSMGVLYQVAENSLQLGASVANFGPRAGYDGRDLYIDYDFDPDKFGDNDGLPAKLRTDDYTLPTVFRVGLSYPIIFSENYKITISVDATQPNDNTESINSGLEVQLTEFFKLRGGYRDLFLEDSEGGLVLGAGLNVDLISYNFTFDYAWADYGRLESVHRFTVGIKLF